MIFLVTEAITTVEVKRLCRLAERAPSAVPLSSAPSSCFYLLPSEIIIL